MSSGVAAVLATGMVTPLGLDSDQVSAALAAGVSRVEASSILNHRLEPMKMALVPDSCLPPLEEEDADLSNRSARLVRLAQWPLEEALRSAPESTSLPLFLAGPEAHPGLPNPWPPEASNRLIQRLSGSLAGRLDTAASRCFPSGRAGGIEALAAGLETLQAGADYVLVGGVDSWLDLRLLYSLDEEKRISAPEVMDGFAPGEAACFLLLASPAAAGGHTPLAWVQTPALCTEPGHRYGSEPYLGEGMAAAVRGALEGWASDPITTLYSSLNGENYSAKEVSVAVTRNSARIDADLVFEHPADSFGDVGAACAPLLVALAARGVVTQDSVGRKPFPALVTCASEGPLRGAVCLVAHQD